MQNFALLHRDRNPLLFWPGINVQDLCFLFERNINKQTQSQKGFWETAGELKPLKLQEAIAHS